MLEFESEEKLLDIPPEDLYLHPEIRNELLSELRETGKLEDRKIEFKVKGGGTILCSATFSAQFDSDGNMIFLDSVIEDITEKERKAEALRQAHNKLNLLSSITRHDIINQLMVLEGYLQLVMEKARDPEELMLLHRMKDNIISIDRHIMFTKDYQEIGIDTPEWFNLRDMLTSTIAPMDNALLEIHVDVHDYIVFSDPMITKVFYNLANNVIKHSKASKLTITTEQQDGQLLVVFQDDGIGIEDKMKLFKKGTSTSGYGLFLSKEILSITGIDIREIGVAGDGARFELIFSQNCIKLQSDIYSNTYKNHFMVLVTLTTDFGSLYPASMKGLYSA
ncbi:MAG: PAS domain-containing sensor histidine kinase [Methanolobus sp.]